MMDDWQLSDGYQTSLPNHDGAAEWGCSITPRIKHWDVQPAESHSLYEGWINAAAEEEAEEAEEEEEVCKQTACCVL